MLVLASSSQRRKEILENLEIEFVQCMPDVEEVYEGNVYSSATENALSKARACAKHHPEDYVLGFDTVVVVDSTVLGKPATKEEARKFLTMLSGRMHLVITGIAIVCLTKKIEVSGYEETKVFFRRMRSEEIEWYLDTGEWIDKAGGYAIQGKASIFVERVDGCYFNVVGLPVGKTYILLRDAGINLNDIF